MAKSTKGAIGRKTNAFVGLAAKRLNDRQLLRDAALKRQAETKHWIDFEQKLQALRSDLSRAEDETQPLEASERWAQRFSDFLTAAKTFEGMTIPEEKKSAYRETLRPLSRLREVAETVTKAGDSNDLHDADVSSVVLVALDDVPSLTPMLQRVLEMGSRECKAFCFSLRLLLQQATCEPLDWQPSPPVGCVHTLRLLELIDCAIGGIRGHQCGLTLKGNKVDEPAKIILNNITKTFGEIVVQLDEALPTYAPDGQIDTVEASAIRAISEIVDCVDATLAEMVKLNLTERPGERFVRMRTGATLVPFEGQIVINLQCVKRLLENLAAQEQKRFAPLLDLLTGSTENHSSQTPLPGDPPSPLASRGPFASKGECFAHWRDTEQLKSAAIRDRWQEKTDEERRALVPADPAPLRTKTEVKGVKGMESRAALADNVKRRLKTFDKNRLRKSSPVG